MDSETSTEGQLDRFDRAILAELERDGRVPVTELARRVGLSKSPCQARMRRLIETGYIQRFRAVLDPARLGLDHVVFVEVKLTDTTEKALAAFNAAARDIPEIEQCHLIAGRFDYLLKVRTRDIRRYREILGHTISQMPHVASTSTNVSMQSIKEDAGPVA